ncbi:glycoside hydrolase family 19 protein [Aquimarina sp. 2201CG5-10]|uniref:glycoside hydrolase family 19 protein n=1 Tax=Aquimarina callyspongiae TaxID=3098150 RepID=UPI002AB448C6|nr:glycoside hydrolase family 19 protein [Aquimarina sp. 2201CG5-10]MDY8136977.1 glycoside hydrolase family 19 protein [Aquimarina sp. 2201CG5-10]
MKTKFTYQKRGFFSLKKCSDALLIIACIFFNITFAQIDSESYADFSQSSDISQKSIQTKSAFKQHLKSKFESQKTNSTSLVTKEQWDVLFPYRFGSKDTGNGWELDPADDFYTYESFIEAINRMSNLTVTFDRRCGTNAYKITRTDKTTGVSIVIRTDADFDAPRNINKEIVTEEVDYGSFLQEGDLETKKREISAFFANISHETTGGWPTAPGGQYSWGLHFREEPTNSSYASPDPNYPPTPGKSYKGRGPMQLSYNYNYGPASEFIFGDKQILLDNPERVIEDAALAFQTAIWFWMTPQYPKPSAHAVMINQWTPNELDQTKNRIPGLGMTVNIINGGVECGQGTEKAQVLDRIGYYERFTDIYNIGTDMDGVHDLSDCGCKDMSPYGGDAADLTAEPCAQKPTISFTSPINNQVIEQVSFSPIDVTLSVDEKNTVLESITTTVGNQSFTGTSFSWTPSSYGTQTLSSTATFQNGLTATSSIKVILWDGVNLDCSEIPEWESNIIYDKPNNYVKYNNIIYRNKWYADSSNIPGSAEVWESIKECNGNPPNAAPVVSWNSPTNAQIIETETLETLTLTATATDSDGNVQSFFFEHNGTVINATQNGNQYTAAFTPTAFGNVSIKASATDNENKTTESTITFTIKEKSGANTPPVISGIEPANAQIIEQTQLTAITLSALANDDVSVASVVFSVNNTTLTPTQNSTGAYTINWTPTAFGSVTFKITATDNEGLSSESNTTFTIQEKITGGDCNDIPSWEAKAYPTGNTEVSYNGKVYKNKWYAEPTDIPGSSNVWDYIKECDGAPVEYCGSQEWSASATYNTGDTAYYEQKIYRAKWWTQNNVPSTSNEWEYVSDCPIANRSNAKVYPTTVKDLVTIELYSPKTTVIKIDLYDFSGRKIRTIERLSSTSATNILSEDLTDLKNGLYIYRIRIGKTVYVEKFIKE